MSAPASSPCANCKREIPTENFTVHSLHCARNIRVCPVCKEPVPASELQDHHNQLHKLVPCKHCGEGVCGTDLEDHVRDSCAYTVGACRFCELELPRRDLPEHEAYCGTRTEKCAECGELVMLKYKLLHEESNHTFLKLKDEPGPQATWATNHQVKADRPPANSTNFIPTRTSTSNQSTSNSIRLAPSSSQSASTSRPNVNLLTNHIKSETIFRPIAGVNPVSSNAATSSFESNSNIRKPESQVRSMGNEENGRLPLKRTNDRPQINTSVPQTSKVEKDLPAVNTTSPARGGVKKRPAPPPPKPRDPPNKDPIRDTAYWSALSRQQKEERERQEQTAYNLSVGLPPVLSTAAKVEKLRKMDALANREFEDNDYKNKLRGRVWVSNDPCAGEPLGMVPSWDGGDSSDSKVKSSSDLQPMTQAEFANRFNQLQMSNEANPRHGAQRNPIQGVSEGVNALDRLSSNVGVRGDDRFSEIKRELRELRKGLNEVTAPYNSTNNPSNHMRPSQKPARPVRSVPPPRPVSPPQRAPSPPQRAPSPPPANHNANDNDNNVIELPCEFCGVLVPADDLVQHETGCRPDLAQYNVKPRNRPPSPSPERVNSARGITVNEDMRDPVIPCEFCMVPYPMHLLMDHQEECMGFQRYCQEAGANSLPKAARPPEQQRNHKLIMSRDRCDSVDSTLSHLSLDIRGSNHSTIGFPRKTGLKDSL